MSRPPRPYIIKFEFIIHPAHMVGFFLLRIEIFRIIERLAHLKRCGTKFQS